MTIADVSVWGSRECKYALRPSVIHLFVFVNSLVLTFTDLQFGRTALLAVAITINSAVLLSLKNINCKCIFAILLIIYLFIRQVVLLLSDAIVYSETVAAILFILYTMSFSALVSVTGRDSGIIFVRYFLYANLVFGVPDYFGVIIPFLHVDDNEISRFRGLATEPNLLAVPVLIILGGLLYSKIEYVSKRMDILLCVILVYFSYSKAAYLGLAALWFFRYYSSQITVKNLFWSLFTLILIISIYYLFKFENYLYQIPFYNNFLSLVDFELIAAFNVNDYIISLSALDQHQSGSLGTRLATAVASLFTIFDSPLHFLFGVGGGNSYPYLIKYIFDNGLDNFELNLHLSNSPELITDKTYIFKFMSEYGIIGLLLLMGYVLSSIGHIYSAARKVVFWVIAIVFILMLLSQSTFLFVFIFIAAHLVQSKRNGIN